jgi:hypothetical protein
MRVAMMTREYPPEVYGGAGVHVTELVAQLRTLCEVDVHCMGAPRDGAFVHQPDPALKGANPALATLSADLVMANAAESATVVHSHTWYTGLAGQSVGVLVWTDRGIHIDWPTLPLDAANAIENKMMHASAHELDKTKFPVEPASILRYQQDHPDIDAQGVLELAPQLGVSRLLYVEVEDFSTRAAASLDLYRGTLTGTLKVIEIKDGKAKVAYEEPNIRAVYPPKSPEEGVPRGNDYQFYLGTVDAFTTEVVHRLVSHSEDE